MIDKLYSVTDLLELMSEQGLPSSRVWLYTAERKGKLICPRRPNTRRDRMFTESQMEEIVKEFSPGGTGEWKYESRL